MRQNSTSQKILFAITLLFSLIVAFKINHAQAAAVDQIPGNYTAHVTYMNADKPAEKSMIETGGLWDKNIKYTVAADGSSTLIIQQEKMMNYMSEVNYIGKDATGKRVAMKKTVVDDNNGSWQVQLTPALTAELQAGQDVTVGMAYTVPGLFTHNVNVLVKIDSIDEPDRAAYEQNQKLLEQNKKLQEQLDSLKAEVANDKKLSDLQASVKSLLDKNAQIARDLEAADKQNEELVRQVTALQESIAKLAQTVANLKKETGATQPAPRPQGTVYTATVNYTKPGSTENSALNSFFGNKVTYFKDAQGNVTVQIKQDQLMDMMNSVTFNGQKMTKGNNVWTLKYRGPASDLVAGKKFTVGVSYNLYDNVSKHEATANVQSITPDGFGKPVKPIEDPANKPQKAPAQQPAKPSYNKKPANKVQYVDSLQQPGTYFAQVTYVNSDTGKLSMIETSQVWDKNIKLVKNADGTVSVTITQPNMMNYMVSLNFAGVKMTAHRQGKTGYWTATLPASKAQSLKKGGKVLVSMEYNVKEINYNHKVTAYVIINSISVGQKIDAGQNNGPAPLPQVPGQGANNSAQTASTPVGYDEGVPVDGMPVAAPGSSAYLPQTGEHQADSNELTTSLVLLVVAVSGLTGLSIYWRKQNA